MSVKLTYSTMFDPPPELHDRCDAALQTLRGKLGATHALYIGGKDRPTKRTRPNQSATDRKLVLGQFAAATAADVEDAMRAASTAFPAWRATAPAERVRLLRRVAALIEERVYDISAALTLEVGKNRMEALGETQETADFFTAYCDEWGRNGGFDHKLPDDPLKGFASHNRSVMKPYGVWAVITPFNFPLALAGGPVAAALVTGNTVVLKAASDTPWSGRLLADCIRDAGLPPGVFNFLSGSSGEIGDPLAELPLLAGITFTGSVDVGMRLMRMMATGRYPRPCIAEMGGKNACIVTANADLDRAVTGIIRSAFVMGGQKCSALSRLYVHESAEDVQWFFNEIEAGVLYANRPQGATTGAWPGYQPFGGWKGSGSTGKAIASFYYLAQYLREQSQTLVE